MTGNRRVFPLVPRGRLEGSAFGTERSLRRGQGSDVAGSWPYTPRDRIATIDWHATARLSSSRGSDEFVVREHFAEEAPRVVIVCDRRPSMSVYGGAFPWLSKPAALREVTRAVAASTLAARGSLGYLDEADAASRHGMPFWLPPRGGRERWRLEARRDAPFDAPADTVSRALTFLSRSRAGLGPGTFLFVLSDFLSPPPRTVWTSARRHRWDVVPVVIQDPTWEQSFPPLPSLVVPFVDPDTARVETVRLTAAQARERRAAHEERLRRLLRDFRQLGADPVLIETSEPRAVDAAFLAWAERRRASRGRR